MWAKQLSASLYNFSCALPHFIFGEQLLRAPMPMPLHNSTLSGQRSHMLLAPPPDLCMAYDLNTTELPLLEVELARCESEETRDTQRLHSKITAVVLAILFVSLLGVGMGQTAVYTLGIPYIDDNVASRESPLYFGRFFF